MVKISIGDNEKGQRLDKFLRKYLSEASLGFVYKAIRKDVKVNGARRRGEYILESGDEISLYISQEEHDRLHPGTLRGRHAAGASGGRRPRKQFTIAYEDENLLIVEKPAGLLVHGDGREKENHLTNQVIAWLTAEGSYVPAREKTFVPAPVNRIDRNTAGLVIFAKNYRTLQAMNGAIREHRIRKLYLTIAAGELQEQLRLTGYMTRDEARNVTEVISGGAEAAGRRKASGTGEEQTEGKRMETLAVPLAAEDGYTLCQVEIRTGRTHQIRVQMAEAGYPLIGDAKYGDRRVNRRVREQFGLTSQLLLAWRLEFRDMPEDLAYLNGRTVTAKIPKTFRAIEKALFKEADSIVQH